LRDSRTIDQPVEPGEDRKGSTGCDKGEDVRDEGDDETLDGAER